MKDEKNYLDLTDDDDLSLPRHIDAAHDIADNYGH